MNYSTAMPPPPYPPPQIPLRPLTPPRPDRPNSNQDHNVSSHDRLYAPVYISIPRTTWLMPNLDLRVEDVSHPGARLFFENISPADALRDAVATVNNWLYTLQDAPTNVQNVLLVLRPMPGVAYSTGSHTHKEIHLSAGHVQNNAARVRDEIRGVLTHEMVHCYQYNAKGTCPSGLIEGIADWVRLHAGLAPAHWKEGRGTKWDAGYESTAYFLEWIEQQSGRGTVRNLNLGMKDVPYKESIFKDLTGSSVDELWRLYQLDLETRAR